MKRLIIALCGICTFASCEYPNDPVENICYQCTTIKQVEGMPVKRGDTTSVMVCGKTEEEIRAYEIAWSYSHRIASDGGFSILRATTTCR